MAKVLVIRKTDKTIHKVPLSNAASLKSYSNRLPIGQRWTFEEMEEEEANKLPFIDKSYITPGEAQSLVKDLDAKNIEKDARIAELEKKLAELNAGAKKDAPKTAADIIAAINEATTADDVNALISEDETRTTVIAARDKKLAELNG